jgi:hypothetical protein
MPGSPPPSLLGGSLGSVRHLSCGTMRLLRLPLLIPFLFVSFESRLLPFLHFFSLAPGQWSSSRCAWALVCRFRPLLRLLAGKKSDGSLKFPGNPFRAFALLSDPGPISTPGLLAAFQCCPRFCDDEGSDLKHCFEAQSHGFSTRSIRFVPTSLPTTQCSLPAGGQPLPDGYLTHWVPVMGF